MVPLEKSPRNPYDGFLFLGRASTCDIIIRDASISKTHAVIEPSEAGWHLRDNRSRNGTWRNMDRLKDGERVALVSGDVIVLGSYPLYFILSADLMKLTRFARARGHLVAEAWPLTTGDYTNQDLNVPEHETGEDEPRFTAGDRIGRYVLLSSLGKGGMSVVYLAYDPELDRKVALKLMRVTMLGEKGKLRLQREAQALAKLSHPNVVPVYDAGTFADQAFVAMEFVEGKTLRKYQKEEHVVERAAGRDARRRARAGRGPRGWARASRLQAGQRAHRRRRARARAGLRAGAAGERDRWEHSAVAAVRR